MNAAMGPAAAGLATDLATGAGQALGPTLAFLAFVGLSAGIGYGADLFRRHRATKRPRYARNAPERTAPEPERVTR